MPTPQWPGAQSGPIVKLSFQYEDGRRGSLADSSGSAVLILAVSPGCPICKESVRAAQQAIANLPIVLFLLSDEGSREAANHGPGDGTEVLLPVAFAPLPEIYLGLHIPRGIWIKYPSIIGLDASSRIRVFSNNACEVTDHKWINSALDRIVSDHSATRSQHAG